MILTKVINLHYTPRQEIFKGGISMIDISRGFKQVSLPDDFAQTA
jgi:hypothetical protein